MPSLPAPPADQLVTSSDLVRHFGLWQERAARAPLYILHRGRPRFVLTSIETMDALCAPHTATHLEAEDHPAIDAMALLDTIGDLVLVADAAGAIVASSRAARAHFGAIAAAGGPIDAIVPNGARAVLTEAIRRVIAWGVVDRLELISAAREARTLMLTIEPAGGGVAVIGQDVTAERDLDRASAIMDALDAAMGAAPGIAIATIDARGYIADPTAGLAALTGLDRDALAQLRFVTLAETNARATLAAALNAAIAGEASMAIDSVLLVHRGEPIAVQIGLGAVVGGGIVSGVVAAIVAR